MKYRHGPVTNSSSTSFVVIGNKVNYDEIDLSKGEYWCLARWLCDGQNIFKITKELLPYVNVDGLRYMRTVAVADEERGVYIPEGNYDIVATEIDMHSTDNLADFLDYLENYHEV